MVSSTEAASFLVNSLGFQNWKEILEKDRLEFVSVLMKHFTHNIYFQNISMSSLAPEERRVPTEVDIISDCLSGFGGACITQNAFLSILLKALGFNSYVLTSSFLGHDFPPDSHVMCAVEFSPNEKYIMDIGCGLPFEEPVPIHDLPYTQIGGGLRYRYRKSEDGSSDKYERVQLDGSLFRGDYEDKNTENIRYDFTMEPKTLEFFLETLDTIYKTIDKSLQLQSPFVFRYFEEDEEGNLLEQANINGDRKWICILGVTVLIGTNHTRKITHYSTYDEVKEVIFKYFPKLRKEDVEKSIEYFNARVPEHGYLKIQ